MLSLMLSHLDVRRRASPSDAGPRALAAEPARKVWLPSRADLKQLLPAAPRAVAKPPRPMGRDRISIGPPSTQRARELLLRREDDLTATPKGHRGAGETESVQRATAAATAGTRKPETAAAAPTATDPNRLQWPGQRADAGRPLPSIEEYIKRWGERQGAAGAEGLPSGTGQQIGPLFFDPQGADFTVWINHFKNEVYRNWIVPQSVLMGMRGGSVDFEFTVDRSGRLIDLRTIRSAGRAVLDRAAQNALVSSRFLPLPSDYAPATVTTQARFLY
jgi:TonB family protein